MSEDYGERLAKIETKLDILIGLREDHESRLRVMEGWRWKVIGMGFMAGMFAGGLPSLLLWISKGA